MSRARQSQVFVTAGMRPHYGRPRVGPLRLPHRLTRVAAGVLAGLFAFLLLSAIGGLGLYVTYANSLPSPQELYQRAASFRSTKIYDRHGRLLYEVFDPEAGRRTPIPYDQLPACVIRATIATEDGTFFSNSGLSPPSIVRAIYQSLTQGGRIGGTSTITQQLVKNLYFSSEQTLSRKVKEAILAVEITRRYSKTEILEVYLNEVYYGNLAYGIAAAAETYFEKDVSALTLPEAALLVGLLQSPACYDPYVYPQRALARRATVLGLMLSNSYLTQAEYEQALEAPLALRPRDLGLQAPHFVMHVRQELETLYGREGLYRMGLQVYTSLNLDLQQLAEKVIAEKMPALQTRGASNAALVTLDVHTGDILALVGSADFYDRAIDGQFNVVTQGHRQAGSTLKPFVYLAALEHGWTAATMLMDVEQPFPDGPRPPYRPTNHDGRERGPVSLRTALASSLNISAVSTLAQLGVPAVIEVVQHLGIRSLDQTDYGLSLALGSAEVTPLELSAAYATLANGGYRVRPRTILRVEDHTGQVILAVPPAAEPVIDPRHAYLLTHILSDEAARQPTFGAHSALQLSFPAAAKTGTTNDYRDSWTVGYTPRAVTGVWVGNSDNRPMHEVTGALGAGLIWHEFCERARGSVSAETWPKPPGLVEIDVCPVSGKRCGPWCPPGQREIFLVENAPEEACTVHQRMRLCTVSGLQATAFCPPETVQEVLIEDYGPEWDEWLAENGKPVPPRQRCELHAQPIHVALFTPVGPLRGLAQIQGVADAIALGYYILKSCSFQAARH